VQDQVVEQSGERAVQEMLDESQDILRVNVLAIPKSIGLDLRDLGRDLKGERDGEHSDLLDREVRGDFPERCVVLVNRDSFFTVDNLNRDTRVGPSRELIEQPMGCTSSTFERQEFFGLNRFVVRVADEAESEDSAVAAHFAPPWGES
jgi:hypothetical protein